MKPAGACATPRKSLSTSPQLRSAYSLDVSELNRLTEQPLMAGYVWRKAPRRGPVLEAEK